MEHTLAQQTKTIDRYLMSDLSDEERLAFEEHLFDCPACAAQLKEEYDTIAHLKAVLREPALRVAVDSTKTKVNWREWFRPLTFVPACAALGLAMVVGYQNLVEIPGILQPQVLDTTPLVPTTRGTESQSALVKRGAALFAVSFEVFSPAVYSGYVCDFLAEGSSAVTSVDCGQHSTSEFTLSLLLPAAKFRPGGYTMILRPVSDRRAEIGHYSFVVRTGVVTNESR